MLRCFGITTGPDRKIGAGPSVKQSLSNNPESRNIRQNQGFRNFGIPTIVPQIIRSVRSRSLHRVQELAHLLLECYESLLEPGGQFERFAGSGRNGMGSAGSLPNG